MFKRDCSDYKITDVSQNSSVLLNYVEVKELLLLNLTNVKKIQIVEGASELERENKQSIFRVLIQNGFPQLTSLNLYGINSLNADTFQKINLCCPQLEKLALSNCFYYNNNNGVLTDHRGISAIADMKMLKSFIVNEKHYDYELEHILYVIRQLQHVVHLILKVNTVARNLDGNSEAITLNFPDNICQIISFKLRVNFPIFSVNPNSFLFDFKNLQVLSITATNLFFCVNKDVLENLTRTCKHLKNLYLSFCNIENFFALPSLETLTLINCCPLNWMDLKSILSQQNLKSFTSLFTRFSNTFKLFHIESALEYLRIETMEYDFRDELKQLLLYNCQKMKNLSTFIWHDFTLWYADEPIAMQFPLKGTYLNLESMFIDLSVIVMDDILKMKCLKQLAFMDNEHEINLNNLLTIFKHSTLESFTLYTRNVEYKVKISTNEYIGYKINLRLIQIPLSIFNKTTNIWLSILFTNPQLQLVCYCSDFNAFNVEYLKDLIENPNFPARIKSIKICGLTIDCKDLKENPDIVLNSIKAVTEYCDFSKNTLQLKL
ncbi:uncharacterized protein LOC124420696 isoform X2 [Lucilia cuprina]|nr:uncharacterized protein LOC124420696 isoform X2 [Lucilia cuprina]